MTVRAKFYVSNVIPSEGATAAQVQMHPVCRGVENAMWAQATPSGSITMNIKNGDATDQFVKGEEYEVTFRQVTKPAAGDGHPIRETADQYGRIICETCGAITLGYTEAAVAASPHLAEWNTPEKRDAARAKHDEVYGAPVAQDDSAE